MIYIIYIYIYIGSGTDAPLRGETHPSGVPLSLAYCQAHKNATSALNSESVKPKNSIKSIDRFMMVVSRNCAC